MGIPVLIKSVVGYEGLYSVTSDGRIYSHITHKFLKPNITKCGYATVQLFKDRIGKRLSIHRLVARAYIPNPLNKEQVNHKDENKLNNCVSNLEWNTPKENMNYGSRKDKQRKHTNYNTENRKIIARINGKKACKPVVQLKDNTVIKEYQSIIQASRETGILNTKISEVVRNKRKTAGGFCWKYKEVC